MDVMISETPQELSKRAKALLAQAVRLATRDRDDLTLLNRLMGEAKQLRMTWIEGLEYSIAQMKGCDSFGAGTLRPTE